jgi:glutamine---fructose-6-phosphate transaminase (isomerizing)
VIAIILDDDHAMHMRIAAEEVKARGARVFVITDNPKLALGIDNDPLIIPSNGPLTALIAVLPLQVRTTPHHTLTSLLCYVLFVNTSSHDT